MAGAVFIRGLICFGFIKVILLLLLYRAYSVHKCNDMANLKKKYNGTIRNVRLWTTDRRVLSLTPVPGVTVHISGSGISQFWGDQYPGERG